MALDEHSEEVDVADETEDNEAEGRVIEGLPVQLKELENTVEQRVVARLQAEFFSGPATTSGDVTRVQRRG